jgi:hypothetical protein
VTLQGHGHTEDGQGQTTPLELPQDAPHTDPGAILVDALHGEMALGEAGRVEEFGEELLAPGVTVEHAVLGPLFVVEDELHRHPRPPRPVGERRIAAVADEVAGIGGWY